MLVKGGPGLKRYGLIICVISVLRNDEMQIHFFVCQNFWMTSVNVLMAAQVSTVSNMTQCYDFHTGKLKLTHIGWTTFPVTLYACQSRRIQNSDPWKTNNNTPDTTHIYTYNGNIALNAQLLPRKCPRKRPCIMVAILYRLLMQVWCFCYTSPFAFALVYRSMTVSIDHSRWESNTLNSPPNYYLSVGSSMETDTFSREAIDWSHRSKRTTFTIGISKGILSNGKYQIWYWHHIWR